jgi:hypothetical protein
VKSRVTARAGETLTTSGQALSHLGGEAYIRISSLEAQEVGRSVGLPEDRR